MLRQVDLLIFDFDGTLADSIPAAIEAIQDMLKELNLPYKTAEEIKPHVGYGEIPLVSGAIASKDEKLIQKAMESYFKFYLNDRIQAIILYPHVKETLEFFKDKTKVIISNKKDDFIKIILSRQGIISYFTDIFGGDQTPCLKPDPGVVNEILKKYKVPPKRTLFIGDMTVDIETGKNAGILTCAVTYGFTPRDELKKSKPDFLVDDLSELKKFIK